MNTYSSYKDSGVDWIGNIPSDWEVVRNKYLFDVTKNVVGEESDKYQLLSLTKRGVVLRDIESGKGKFPESFDTYQTVDKGDLIFCLYDIDETPRTIGISNYSGMITGSYKVVKCNTLTDPKFIYYNYLSIDDVKGLRPYYTGLRKVVRTETFLNLNVRVPSLQEQQQISDYLDYKTLKIDTLIKKTQQKIELLKEQRISLINTTVTKGLNPNVEMKDSGIEWIGEIPSGWNVTKLKYTCNITYGISPPDTTYNDKGRGEILINGPVEYSKEDFGYTRSTKWTTDPKKFTEKGSLLFCLRGSTGRMNITHDYVSIGRGVCSIISKESQWFMIYSMFIVRDYIQGEITGSTFPSVTKDDVDNYFICTPPQQEQQQIVDYLDKETTKIDKLVDIESKRIILLKEYRQTLISEVVTGKVDVRNEVLV